MGTLTEFLKSQQAEQARRLGFNSKIKAALDSLDQAIEIRASLDRIIDLLKIKVEIVKTEFDAIDCFNCGAPSLGDITVESTDEFGRRSLDRFCERCSPLSLNSKGN